MDTRIQFIADEKTKRLAQLMLKAKTALLATHAENLQKL